MMRLSLLICAIVCSLSVSAQLEERVIAFYNVENLFDTIDAAGVMDEAYTPAGKNFYDTERYETKLNNLARVVNQGCGDQEIAILGLCEVENYDVVNAFKERLKPNKNLSIVHFDSPDKRGIDNAFIYDHNLFNLLDSGEEPIYLSAESWPTRGIVWGVLEIEKHQTKVIVFVNHWPSRYGGEHVSNWKRVKASEVLQSLLMKKREQFPDAVFIVMGDFNDHPDNESILALTNCSSPESPCLVNLHATLHENGRGTYAFRGKWGVLDQILVSKNALEPESNIVLKPNSSDVISFEWMMYESSVDGKLYPSRTYSGDRYYGGYSDHLPVYIPFVLR